MPIGRIMSKSGKWLDATSLRDATKKLTYLKKPRRHKLNVIAMVSHSFARVDGAERMRLQVKKLMQIDASRMGMKR